MTFRFAIAGLAIGIAVAPATAQMVPMPLRGDGPRDAAIAWVITNSSTLRLSSAQRGRVEARAARLEQALAPYRAQLAALRAGPAFQTLPQADRHARVVAAVAIRTAMLAEIDSAAADVRAALSPAQLATVTARAPAAAASPCTGGTGSCVMTGMPADSGGMRMGPGMGMRPGMGRGMGMSQGMGMGHGMGMSGGMVMSQGMGIRMPTMGSRPAAGAAPMRQDSVRTVHHGHHGHHGPGHHR